MGIPLTFLNVVAFSLGDVDCRAILRVATVGVESDIVDAKGMERYQRAQTVKQGQKLDFVVEQLNGLGMKDSNLDISLWSVGGIDYLATLKSGVIEVTTQTRDASSIAALHKVPTPTGTEVEVRMERMVAPTSDLLIALADGSAPLAVTVSIQFGNQAFSAPMHLRAGSVKVERGELIMERSRLALQGPPTGPTDGSLLAIAMLGTAAIGFALDTGGGSFQTGVQVGILTSLKVRFTDGALVEVAGTLEVQGPMTTGGLEA